MTEVKGVEYLIDAFARLQGKLPNTKLVLIGDGPRLPALKAIVECRSLSKAVCFAGAMRNRELPPWFRAASIVATPSITTRRLAEQVCMVNIQSIACGTPVVTTDSGSIPEFIDHGVSGLVVPERNVSALADAMERLLTSPELLACLSRNGRRIAEQRYDARTNAMKAEDIILDGLGRKSVARS